MKRLSVLWAKGKVRSECRIHGNADPIIEKVTFSSQSCTPNSVFIAFTGIHIDAHTFIDQAIGHGAAVIVHEKELASYDSTVVYIQHPNPRRIASLFCRVLADPLPEHIIGVTGTDGKSSTCEFLYHFMNEAHIKCGLLSTISMDDGTGKVPSPYRQSTPEVPLLYDFLSRCKANGIRIVILEATSHGLSEQAARLVDIPFAGAIFTPITSEHLEFHGTMEAYVDAKMNLARQVGSSGHIVIPADFSYRKQLKQNVKEDVTIHSYAGKSYQNPTDLRYESLAVAIDERKVHAIHPKAESLTCTIPFGQECYTQNAMGAYLYLIESGLWETPGYSRPLRLPAIPGRFEIVQSALPFTIVVDFAHTANAFELLFTHVRNHAPQARIIALFGAAGERDKSKRFPMGSVAGKYCNAVFLTDEDPRGEDSSTILDDLEMGIRSVNASLSVLRIHDRQKAIQKALEFCKPGDVLLLLAKSHEKSIAYKDHSIDWDERMVVEKLISEKEADYER